MISVIYVDVDAPIWWTCFTSSQADNRWFVTCRPVHHGGTRARIWPESESFCRLQAFCGCECYSSFIDCYCQPSHRVKLTQILMLQRIRQSFSVTAKLLLSHPVDSFIPFLGGIGQSISDSAYCDRCYHGWSVYLYVCMCVCHAHASY